MGRTRERDSDNDGHLGWELWTTGVLSLVLVLMSAAWMSERRDVARYRTALEHNTRAFVFGDSAPGLKLRFGARDSTSLDRWCREHGPALVLFVEADCEICSDLVAAQVAGAERSEDRATMVVEVGSASSSGGTNPEDGKLVGAWTSTLSYLGVSRQKLIPAAISLDEDCRVRGIGIGLAASNIVAEAARGTR